MSRNLEDLADRFEIGALSGEFADAIMTRDYDRFASLFTDDGAWRIPYVDVELVGRHEIRAGIERMQQLWEYFVQTTHSGAIELHGDTAVGRAYIEELGRLRDGRSERNVALSRDRYQRTEDGWRFVERVYEVRYLDRSPLRGVAPDPVREPQQSDRPHLGVELAESHDVIDAFVAGLQADHDHHDADTLNQQFATDVAWGSPYGALICGYDQLHPIHQRLRRDDGAARTARYEVRHILPVTDDVIVAHVARVALDADGNPLPPIADPDTPFSEMAMFVLVRRNGGWWLAAGQNTPIRSGGAVPAIG